MQFSTKHLMALGLALVLASGTHAAYAQQVAPEDAAVPSTAAVTPEPASAASSEEAASSQSAESESASVSESTSASASTLPAVTQLNDVPPPPEGKGQVVFFRPSRFVGAAVSFSVREGDTGIGKLTNGTYFVQITDPGTKEYNISFEARDTLRMEVEEGETYYVIQSIGVGVVAARPNLTPSSEAAFQGKKLKVSKAKPTDRK